ncbi:MAG: hypothetical protein J7K80_00315, partial [Candidatus Izimaplasma sp.]|nr:hypothetical protein [Candidatus Izimaplasma bacterium]
DLFYLFSVFYLGVKLVQKRNDNILYLIFGLMALTLGFGDMFHLIPRIVGHLTTGLDDYTYYLGLGKAITSFTMVFFYILVLYAYEKRFNVKKVLTRLIIVTLLIIKIILSILPQNEWLTNTATLEFQIIRNIPFVLMGIYLVVLFIVKSTKENDIPFLKIAIGILLSFLFYIPVVLFASKIPAIGALMMPKTLAYVYVIYIAYKEM